MKRLGPLDSPSETEPHGIRYGWSWKNIGDSERTTNDGADFVQRTNGAECHHL